jgi:hypothetical protein
MAQKLLYGMTDSFFLFLQQQLLKESANDP